MSQEASVIDLATSHEIKLANGQRITIATEVVPFEHDGGGVDVITTKTTFDAQGKQIACEKTSTPKRYVLINDRLVGSTLYAGFWVADHPANWVPINDPPPALPPDPAYAEPQFPLPILNGPTHS